MEVKQQELEKSLSSGRPTGVYLFLGQERYLKERCIGRIKSAIFGGSDPGMNFERFSAASAGETETFVGLALTMPFLAKGRLLILEDAEKADKKGLERLTLLAEKTLPTTNAAVLISSERTLDKRKKAVKAMMEKAVVTVFWPLFENQIPAFVREEAAGRGKEFEPEAMSVLVSRVGRDLCELTNEIEKLCVYAGRDRLIRIGAVKALVEDRTGGTVTAFADAVAAGEVGRAAIEAAMLLEDDPDCGLMLVKVAGDNLRFVLQARVILAVNPVMGAISPLVREWSAIEGRSDFRSNSRKREIRERVASMTAGASAEIILGVEGWSGGKDTWICGRPAAQVMKAFKGATVYDETRLLAGIAAAARVEGAVKSGTMSMESAVMVLLGTLSIRRRGC